MTYGVAGLLIVIWTIVVWVIYHKIFTVYYFDLSRGLGKEFVLSFFAGVILTALTIYLFWLVAIIVIVAGLIVSTKIEDKNKKIIVIVIFAVLAILVLIFGKNLKTNLTSDKNASKTTQTETTVNNTYVETEEKTVEEKDTEIESDQDSYEDVADQDVTQNNESNNLKDDSNETSSADTDSEYILPNSDSTYITEQDLTGLTAQECFCARNEIYARKGRMFNSSFLQNYFNGKSWYKGIYSPEEFSDDMLNQYEKANAATILSYEKKMGYDTTGASYNSSSQNN